MSEAVTTYVDRLAKFVPEFRKYWESDQAAFNFGSESTIHGVFSDFSTLVIDQLESGTLKHPSALFAFIESTVVAGGSPANAACTCFLENILNHVPGSIEPEGFVSLLGKQSAEFCRGWDEFTGVNNRGL